MSSQQYERHIESDKSSGNTRDVRDSKEFRRETNIESGYAANQQSSEKEAINTTHVHVQASVPLVAPQPPIIALGADISKDLAGLTNSIAVITAETNKLSLAPNKEILDRAAREDEQVRRELEKIAEAYEKEVGRKSEQYRQQTEAEAHKIRKMLEEQHFRDIAFRQQIVDAAIERQKKEIELEARYARRGLEREGLMAKAALEQSKMATNVVVNFDSAVGHTVSAGNTVSSAEASSVQTPVR